MTTHTLDHRPDNKSIDELVHHYEDGNLNLQPGFQRQSVWNERDRARLIDSLLRNYPLPAIFLYRRTHDGRLIYDVIDGKQRLESIFMFMGVMRGRYRTKTQLMGADDPEWIDWNRLCKRRLQHLITGYEIPVIIVDGEFGDIIDVFVRINSTGKALTSQEKRHAKYYNSPFLKEAAKVARRFEKYFRDMGVMSAGQISRMKHIELICELMLSIHRGDVINKKQALDHIMKAEDFGRREIKQAAQKTTTALRRIKCDGVKLLWSDFTVDHIDPYSKGGQTRIKNAALMCRACNSAKGNKR